MSKIVQPRTLSGFMELLPKEQILFNNMKEKIKAAYERFGFLPLDTPVVELSEVLLAKAGGETEKQIYSFQKGDHNLSLRFDLTVPLAKYVAMHQGELAFPFRRYQIGKVYRGERAQAGRFREFYQCDIDIIGDETLSLIYDSEIPSIIYNIFKELKLGDFTICMNNRKLLNGLFASLGLSEIASDVMRIIDKLEKIGKENVIAELKELGVSKEAIDKVMDFIAIQGSTGEVIEALEGLQIQNEVFVEGLAELKEVTENVKLFGVPEENFKIDLTIARGLDYYTGTVYETFLNDYRQIGSICSGGRYENLAEFYTTKKLPGVGISIGLTRLFYQLNELGILEEAKKSISDVLVVPAFDEIKQAIVISNQLREAGINTESYLNDKKLKAKMKYADKLDIPFLVIIGEEELKENLVSLKNMLTGEQVKVSLEQAINMIKKER